MERRRLKARDTSLFKITLYKLRWLQDPVLHTRYWCNLRHPLTDSFKTFLNCIEIICEWRSLRWSKEVWAHTRNKWQIWYLIYYLSLSLTLNQITYSLSYYTTTKIPFLVIFIGVKLIELLLILHFLQSISCRIESKQAILARPRIVLNYLIHLSIMNDEHNTKITQLRNLDGLLDKRLLSFTFQIDALEPVVYKLLGLLQLNLPIFYWFITIQLVNRILIPLFGLHVTNRLLALLFK